jgi:hypothetical protein
MPSHASNCLQFNTGILYGCLTWIRLRCDHSLHKVYWLYIQWIVIMNRQAYASCFHIYTLLLNTHRDCIEQMPPTSADWSRHRWEPCGPLNIEYWPLTTDRPCGPVNSDRSDLWRIMTIEFWPVNGGTKRLTADRGPMNSFALHHWFTEQYLPTVPYISTWFVIDIYFIYPSKSWFIRHESVTFSAFCYVSSVKR